MSRNLVVHIRMNHKRNRPFEFSFRGLNSEEKMFTNKESPEIDLRYESVSNQPLPPPPPPAEEEEEEDHFSLADQIRATPERNLRGKKNKKNRRSHEIQDEIQSTEPEEVPPPLPPKKLSPSPKKGMSLEKQPSEEEEIEAVPVKVRKATVIFSLNKAFTSSL